MANEKKYRYIQFPLCLIKETYRDVGEGLNLIFSYGLAHFAESFKYDLREVARQMMYAYYRKLPMIQGSLYNKIESYATQGLLTIDVDYCGFSGLQSGREFDPLDVSSELIDILESDNEFKGEAITRYQIQQAVSPKFLGIKLNNIDNQIRMNKKAIELKTSFEKQFGKDAMPTCKMDFLFSFNDDPSNIDLFRAYIAVSSLIGQRNFITSNKPAVLSRMVGLKSKQAFEYFTTQGKSIDKNILTTVEKYSKRYHMDNLLLTLAERKFIMYLTKPKVSVIYFSKYMTPSELAAMIKEKKSMLDLKQQMKDATASL